MSTQREAFHRAGGLIVWQKAHAEAGQDTLKRPSMPVGRLVGQFRDWRAARI